MKYDLVYLESCKDEKIKKIIEFIKQTIEKVFIDYEYINHYLLFTGRIKSCRALLDLATDYGDWNCRFYDLLFSNDKWRTENIEIQF